MSIQPSIYKVIILYFFYTATSILIWKMNYSRSSNISLFLILGSIIISSACHGQVLVNNYNLDYRQSWKKLKTDLDTAFLSKGPVTEALFKLLKSSSFPTAVASNLSNQKCVNDSQLYVTTLYSLSGSNASWARQSKITSLISNLKF